jgi:hypothetical protein
MYTFYFQAYPNFNYKLVAYKGPEPPTYPELGYYYLGQTLDGLVDSGYRVVIQPKPADAINEYSPAQMFYAPGWRSSKIAKVAGFAENAKTERICRICSVTGIPVSECKVHYPDFHAETKDAVYRTFVNWANGDNGDNGGVKDFCGEDFGQDPVKADSLEREIAIPGIGPLPPMAPLAPIGRVYGMWHSEVSVPAAPTDKEKRAAKDLFESRNGPIESISADDYLAFRESQALKTANSTIAGVAGFAENAKPSWRQLFKKWFNPEF